MESESPFSPCKFYSVWAANLKCALKQIQSARPNKCKMGRCCAQFQSVRQQFYQTEALSFYVVVFVLFSPLCDILSLFYYAILVLARTAAACPIGNMVSGEIARGFAKTNGEEDQCGGRYF